MRLFLKSILIAGTLSTFSTASQAGFECFAPDGNLVIKTTHTCNDERLQKAAALYSQTSGQQPLLLAGTAEIYPSRYGRTIFDYIFFDETGEIAQLVVSVTALPPPSQCWPEGNVYATLTVADSKTTVNCRNDEPQTGSGM
jgi:hypothetical protein